MLLVKDYKKSFGSDLVLDVPFLQLDPALYWIQGGNGSGKTTFLKSVAGLLPFTGEIYVDDLSIRKHRRLYTACVNYAGAEPEYPDFLTGNDLVRFYAGTKKGNEKMVGTLSAAFGMNNYLGNKISSYSSGMTKKLALLLAFIGESKLILLDEPFSTLDVEAAGVLQSVINEKVSAGILFCISSHQPVTIPHVPLSVQAKTILRQPA